MNQDASMDFFKERIKSHLDQFAESDSLFNTKYKSESKNINDCIQFILNQVKNSGRIGFDDDEIFGMAIHYYDEETIDIGSKISCTVISNTKVELSDEEIQKAKDEAYQKLVDKQLKEISKPKKTVVKTSDSQQSLF